MPVVTMHEDRSASTYENFKYARKLIPQAKSIVIASDCYHIARAKLVAKHFGFAEISYTCPKPDYYPTGQLFYHYLRETAGFLAYAIRLPFME